MAFLSRLASRTTSLYKPHGTRCFQTLFDLQQNPQALTKIVATIGPTSEQAGPLKLCVENGMKIMRLNFSHATLEEVDLRCRNLKTADPSRVTSILLDTKGPELRTGKLANDVSGHDTVDLIAGNTVTLHSNASTLPDPAGSTATDLLIDFPVLTTVLEPGRLVKLDDGAVVLTVETIDASNGTVKTAVKNPGSLRSRAGVNLPLADTAAHLPALSEKDKADIELGMKYDIDFVAASFIQTAEHVNDIRKHCEAVAKSMPEWGDKPLPKIISKIETASALRNFNEILQVSDAIMVARGDLGVEIPLHQVNIAQKEMIKACNAYGKPVIVATQMLETMSKKVSPTRAEVADVTNAVFDGADAVMLSGETAKGSHPEHVISTMMDICRSAEYAIRDVPHTFTQAPPQAALAHAAVVAASHVKAVAILVELDDDSDQTAGFVSAYRPSVPIVTSCQSYKQARHVQLFRGVYPVVEQQHSILQGMTGPVVGISASNGVKIMNL